MFQLNLSSQQQAALELAAAQEGTDVSTFVWRAVEERLQGLGMPSLVDAPFDVWDREFCAFVASKTHRAKGSESSETTSRDQRKAAYRAFIQQQPSHNPNFDDSRDSIYD
jgi:hypothetical protein